MSIKGSQPWDQPDEAEWVPVFEKVTREELPFWKSGYLAATGELVDEIRAQLVGLGFTDEKAEAICRRLRVPTWALAVRNASALPGGPPKDDVSGA